MSDLLLKNSDENYRKDMMNDEFSEELTDAGWNVLQEHSGVTMEEWIEILFEEYPTEIVDAFGADEKKVRKALKGWWETMTSNKAL